MGAGVDSPSGVHLPLRNLLDVPVLFLHGDQDPRIPSSASVKTYDELRSLIRSGRASSPGTAGTWTARAWRALCGSSRPSRKPASRSCWSAPAPSRPGWGSWAGRSARASSPKSRRRPPSASPASWRPTAGSFADAGVSVAQVLLTREDFENTGPPAERPGDASDAP